MPEAQVGIGPARLRDELFGFGSGVTSCHEGGMGSHQDDAAVDGSSAPSESQTAVISVLMRLFYQPRHVGEKCSSRFGDSA